MESVTLDKWKYIYNLADMEKSLYDLNTDPGERKLITQEPERAAALHAMLAAGTPIQFTYYTRRSFDSYVGCYTPTTDLLDRVPRSARRLPGSGQRMPPIAVAAKP